MFDVCGTYGEEFRFGLVGVTVGLSFAGDVTSCLLDGVFFG